MNRRGLYSMQLKRTMLMFILIMLGSHLSLLRVRIGNGVPVIATEPFEADGMFIIPGAPIHGANGVFFDGDDLLYIASVGGREIVVMDPETGEIIDRLGIEKGVEGPDDVTIGPDGSVYWTALFTGEVGRLSPDGVKTGQFVAPGVNPITFSDDGRLFVALDFLGDALYELDPNLEDPPRLIAENLGSLNAMDFGPDGRLYGPIFTESRVVRIDVDADPFAMETVADGFGVPAAVKFDTQGRLHVVDITGQVLRVDTATGSKEVIATNMPGSDNLAFDSSDRLFVSNAHDGSIKEVLPNGAIRQVSRGGMILAAGVAVLNDSVYVADTFTLREFDHLTLSPKSIEHHLFVPGEITSPITVFPDGNNLILSSWFANEVQVWNPETDTVVEDYLDFAVPLNAIRFQGDLIVAELGTGRVVRASATERVTLAETDIVVPAGLAATDDDLWVGDWASGIVWQIVADGVTLSEPIPVAMGLSGPEGLATDLDGTLLVVETGAGRLVRIDPATGVVSTVVEGLEFTVDTIPNTPPLGMFNGVAVGPTGAIYVTGDKTARLYVLNYADIVSTLTGEVATLEGEKATFEGQVSSLEGFIVTWQIMSVAALVIGIVLGAAIIYMIRRP